MANWDHADNIGTHPAFSQDPETRLRARLEAAERDLTRAEQAYTAAQAALAEFTLRAPVYMPRHRGEEVAA